MHRVDASDYITTSGKRLYKETPIPATVLGFHQMNSIQEEIAGVIEDAGLTLRATGAADGSALYASQLNEAIDIKISVVSSDVSALETIVGADTSHGLQKAVIDAQTTANTAQTTANTALTNAATANSAASALDNRVTTLENTPANPPTPSLYVGGFFCTCADGMSLSITHGITAAFNATKEYVTIQKNTSSVVTLIAAGAWTSAIPAGVGARTAIYNLHIFAVSAAGVYSFMGDDLASGANIKTAIPTAFIRRIGSFSMSGGLLVKSRRIDGVKQIPIEQLQTTQGGLTNIDGITNTMVTDTNDQRFWLGNPVSSSVFKITMSHTQSSGEARMELKQSLQDSAMTFWAYFSNYINNGSLRPQYVHDAQVFDGGSATRGVFLRMQDEACDVDAYGYFQYWLDDRSDY